MKEEQSTFDSSGRPGASDRPSDGGAPPAAGQKLSVIILTLNEAPVIERCMASVRGFADEVVVVDSGSTDGTCGIAERAGARVVEQAWPGGFGEARNAAMRHARHDWCLHLDADEIVERPLAEAILTALADSPDPRDGFAVTRQAEFAGVAIPSLPRPKRRLDLVRLVRRERTSYNHDFHETAEVEGRRILLPGRLYHWRSFSLSDRFAQDNRQSDGEAAAMFARRERASVLKLVAMPIARFGWHYVFDRSWQAGRVGLIHAMTKACAEFMRQAKLWELQRGPVEPPQVDIYGEPGPR